METEKSNVKCYKCNCYMWIGWCKKTEKGYICNDCIKKQEEKEK